MEQQDQHPGKILVVDDEESVGELLQQWLTKRGYFACHALNFDEVRSFFEKEPFDLVTLDIMMPGVDGLQILRWIREQYPDVGVIMATALEDLDYVLEAMRLGAINYLIKPFNMDLIAEEIERGMERQRLIAENRSYQQELEKKVEERTRQLREAHARLAWQVRVLEGRDRLVHFQMAMHTLKEAYAEVLEVLKQVLGVERGIIFWPSAAGDRLEAVAAMGLSTPGHLEETAQISGLPTLPVEEESGPQVRAFKDKKLMKEAKAGVIVPILYREKAMGVLQVWCPEEPEAAEEETLDTLWRLGGEAALVLRAALVAEELENDELSFDELERIGEME